MVWSRGSRYLFIAKNTCQYRNLSTVLIETFSILFNDGVDLLNEGIQTLQKDLLDILME